MKLSNKIALAAIAAVILTTVYTMVVVKIEIGKYFSGITAGNGVIKTFDVPIQDFSALDASDYFDIHWSRGIPQARVQVDSNLMEYVAIRQNGMFLTIAVDSLHRLRVKNRIRIELQSDSLVQIDLQDHVKLTLHDTLRQTELRLNAGDYTNAKLPLEVAFLNIELDDFSDVRAGGRAATLNVTMGDHADLNGKSLVATNADCKLQDFASARFRVTERLKANCSDHADLRYAGPDSLRAETQATDFADIRKSEFSGSDTGDHHQGEGD
ncbi:MAG: DUF2807 domain-containing protein [Saprospiraceae bacterium]|jgi:hypothetical protein|nr:DUF2807 domain-containing protein [Saprospiraceae bacterium]MBP9210183.1 DUF2807 domain-containing protein [Saprospiraceae bacterium]MBV6473470.1 hypothetical protein [Saprospiraceae bacterium]